MEGITPECLSALSTYSWPGNILELRNVIERSIIVCDDYLTLSDLPVEIQSFSSSQKNLPQNEFELAGAERRHIEKVLRYTKGNKTEASRLLKIGLTTLYRKIEEYKIVLNN